MAGSPGRFFGLDELSAAQQKLSPNVTGIVAHQTFQGMVNTARVLVPGFKRVALVGDPPGRDTYRLNYGPDIAALAAEVELIDLTGMAVTEVRKRVAVLPNDAVVFYTSIFVDGAGVVHTPQSALLAISGATSRPIITDVESDLGYGAVGGLLSVPICPRGRPCVLRVAFSTAKTSRKFPLPKLILISQCLTGANSSGGTSQRTDCQWGAISAFDHRACGISIAGRSAPSRQPYYFKPL